MKKLLTAIAAAVFLIYPCVVFSSYIIHLKDGREFVTEQYYEEGDQIKFKRYGGVIGIQKDLVREIEVIEEAEELPADKEKAAPAKHEAGQSVEKEGAEKEGGAEAEGKVKEGKEGASESPEKAVEVEKPKEQGEPEKGLDDEKGKEEREKKAKKIDVAQYEKEKRALLERYRNARENLEKARKTGDKALRREAKRELKEIEKLQKDLAIKLKKENNGTLPAWWYSQSKPE